MRFKSGVFSQDNQLKLMVQNHRFSQTSSKIIPLPWPEIPPKLGVERAIDESISCYQQLMTAKQSVSRGGLWRAPSQGERRSCSALSSGTPVAQLVVLSWSFSAGTLQPASTSTTDGTTQISTKGTVILAQLNLVIMCHLSKNFSMIFQQTKACNVPMSHPLWLPLTSLFFSFCVCKK